MCLHLAAAIFNADGFHVLIYDGMSLFSICASLVFLVNVLSMPFYFIRILTKGKGKNGSSVANTSIISPIIPFLIVFVAWWYIDVYSRSDLVDNFPIEILTTTG
ncbi:hypothetical protein MXB_2823, partial [Myxobolus squamalis]